MAMDRFAGVDYGSILSFSFAPGSAVKNLWQTRHDSGDTFQVHQ